MDANMIIFLVVTGWAVLVSAWAYFFVEACYRDVDMDVRNQQEIANRPTPIESYRTREAELRKKQQDKERAQQKARVIKAAARQEAALALVAEQKARQPEIRAQRERARASV